MYPQSFEPLPRIEACIPNGFQPSNACLSLVHASRLILAWATWLKRILLRVEGLTEMRLLCSLLGTRSYASLIKISLVECSQISGNVENRNLYIPMGNMVQGGSGFGLRCFLWMERRKSFCWMAFLYQRLTMVKLRQQIQKGPQSGVIK